MKFTIRWKLMASYLLLVLVMGGVLYAYLFHTLGKYLVDETREGLLSEARLARITAREEIGDMRRDAPAVATAIAGATRARVTIIALTGEVVGDSEVSPRELRDLENHLHRPEVQDALKKKEGDSIRYSATLRYPMLYVAYPFTTTGKEGGIIRLSLPLTVLEKAKGSIHALLAASLVLATILSLVLSYILSNVTSRSLRTMASVAARIGRGELKQRIPVRTGDEVGELARVMNDMAIRIESQLTSIAAEKTRLDTILRGMGEGLMVAGRDGIVTLVNPAFHALFDIRDEVEGRPLIDITRHPALHKAFNAVVTTKTELLEETTLQLEPEKIVLTHWVPLVKDGEFQGVVAVFHDISELKRLERVRKDFVANVSHELRTPVAVIRGYADTILAEMPGGDPHQVARFVEIIRNHAERLSHLVTDLLTLSELETHGILLDLSPTSVAGAVGQACLLLEQKARDKGITVDWSGVKESPQVLADRARLEQVLVNLLDNALNYTSDKGSITFSAGEAGKMTRIAISDTGIGIPGKDLSRIFERFYRVDASRSRDQGGTGLGLSIVRHIVQLHGGVVTVESTPGKGSTFAFTLPRA
jgi:two-component system, OmpR family, phosphate regulon sensor histidine kinase PhoR